MNTTFSLMKELGRCVFSFYYTVKPVHEVTSIKQSPVFKGHPFSNPIIENIK